MQCSLGNQGGLARKVLPLIFVFKGLIVTVVEPHVLCPHSEASTLLGRYWVTSRSGRVFRVQAPSLCGPQYASGNNGGEEEYLVPGIEPRLCNSCAARARNWHRTAQAYCRPAKPTKQLAATAKLFFGGGDILILEVGTDTLSRNVSDKPSHAVQQP